VGSHLFARAGQCVASLGVEAVRLTGEAAAALHTGQAREIENAYNDRIPIDEHLEILQLKTSSLFTLAVALGGLRHRERAVQRPSLEAYAVDLGLAFQLTDDLLDLTGDPADLGKDLGDDLNAGVYSLPLLLALGREDRTARALRQVLARERLSADELARVFELLAESAVLPQVREMAQARARRAERSVASLPAGDARRSLESIARFAVERAA
jgi:heptaprenyl diphosphate synthase